MITHCIQYAITDCCAIKDVIGIYLFYPQFFRPMLISTSRDCELSYVTGL
jgi:hypothetical protein